MKIKHIYRESYSGNVYNFEVEGTHTYLANDVVVHNCHENSRPDGKHADLFSPSFLDNLHPYTELAIGGGNPLSHPDLLKFLLRCRENKWIPSMTVNQVHFEKNFDFIKQLADSKLIYGIGVSLTNPSDTLIDKLSQLPTAVVHIIAGLVTAGQLIKLKNHNIKILILGYKVVRRGANLYEKYSPSITAEIENLKHLLPVMATENWFKVISFDNLALNQLDVKNTLDIDDEDWKSMYMGDDGIDGNMTSSSMFIDMVERKYAKNSCDMDRYPLKETIEEMFNHLRNSKLHEVTV